MLKIETQVDVNKKKIFIIWHGGCKNKGCEALLTVMVKVLYRIFKDKNLEISCTSWIPEYDRQLFPDVNFIKVVPLSGSYKQDILKILGNIPAVNNIFKKILKHSKKDTVRNYFQYKEKIINEIKTCNYIFAIGGDYLGEYYGSLDDSLEYIKLAKKHNKKIYLIGQSIGPFSKKNIDKVKKILRQVDFITVREPKTYEYLKKNGFDMAKIKLTKDLAFDFGLEGYQNKIIDQMIPKNCSLNIGVNLSAGIAKYSKIKRREYFYNMFELISYLIKKYPNSRVYLIPHNFFPNDDDRIICNRMVSNINDSQVVSVCNSDKDVTARQIKYIISKMDIFIGARTHSTIAAWTTNIPTLAIAYSTKAYGLVEYIFGKNSMKNYIIDIRKTSFTNLKDKVDYIIRNKDKIKKEIRKSIKKVNQERSNIITINNK